MSEAKKALETAIGKVGKAYGELLRVAEKHGDDISKDDYAKAQFFLDATLKKIWDKIDVVRDIAKATAGEFSLDSVEMPATKTIVWQAFSPPEAKVVEPLAPEFREKIAQPADMSQLDGKSLAKVIGGRLTKHAQANISRPQPSINTDLDGDDDDESADVDDLLSDVDFIDDK